MFNQSAPEKSGANLQKKMYLGKRKIENIEEYEKRRLQCIKYKADATFTAFSELEGLLNKSQLAQQYFNKSRGWISQRINGCMVLNKERTFNEREYHELAEAFRDIAKRLLSHADEIDDAIIG